MSRIAVIGGGIAGLTLAAALERHGVPYRVYERSTRPREVGAGVQLSPNATRLLYRIGLAGPLRAAGVRMEAIETRRWDGAGGLARTPLGAECERRWGAPYLTLLRPDLHQALGGVVPPDRVALGRRCVAVADEGDDVRLDFADGTSERAEAVAGADGVRSAVRPRLATDAPRFSGETIYRGVVPVERLARTPEPCVRLWPGPGRHVVRYPVAGGSAVSFAATAPATEGAGGDESWFAEGDPAQLRALYRGWDPEVEDLLSAAASVSRWALHDREPLTRWSTGRITLLGDAAHPMLPFMAQGANQAVEDAFALAAELAEGDVPTALRRYEDRRLVRTTELVSRSRAATRTFHLDDGDAQADRDAAWDADAEGSSFTEWLYGHDAEARSA